MTNIHNMPGPGDEITWPPCTGHPMDPRTPDESYLEEARFEETLRRIHDEEYLCESFGEASNTQLMVLSQSIPKALEAPNLEAKLQALQAIGVHVINIVSEHCTPDSGWEPK